MATSCTGLLVIKRPYKSPYTLRQHTPENVSAYTCKITPSVTLFKCTQVLSYAAVRIAVAIISESRHVFAAHLFVSRPDLASFIAVQPEFTGSRTRHSETITLALLKMNHTFVLLFAGFIAAIKVFIIYKPRRELQRFPSSEYDCVKALCFV